MLGSLDGVSGEDEYGGGRGLNKSPNNLRQSKVVNGDLCAGFILKVNTLKEFFLIRYRALVSF